MKRIAAAVLAFTLAGCAAQAAQGQRAPKAAAPSQHLQACQRDFDCDGNRSCIEGYCR